VTASHTTTVDSTRDYRSPATAAPLKTATSTTSATTTAAAPFVRDVLDNDMPHHWSHGHELAAPVTTH